MKCNDIKSYFRHLNKLVDEYNSGYHSSICKKPIDDYYSALTEEIETDLKTLKLKVADRVRITKHKNIFSKCYNKKWSERYLWLILCWKLILGSIWLNREKMIWSFYEKKTLLSNLQMSYYPETDNHIKDKVKEVLHLSNYAT